MSDGQQFGKSRSPRKRRSKSRRSKYSNQGSLGRSLHIEALEDRRLLRAWTVVNLEDLRDDGGGGLEVVPGSLRDAILQANEIDEPHTIMFNEGLQGTIYLQRDGDNFGQLDLVRPYQILGPGPRQIAIQAAPGSRIFNVADGDDDAGARVQIGGLTLTGGSAFGSDDDGRGGAIFNKERLSLTEVVITGNSASNGGGIFQSIKTSSLTIERSLISGNSAGNGGGIYNGLEGDDTQPTTTIINSTLSGNSANPDSGYGGGLFNRNGTVNILNSTISENSAYLGTGVGSWGNPLPEDEESDPPPETIFTTVTSSILAWNSSADLATVGMEGDIPLLPSARSGGYNIIRLPGPAVDLLATDLPKLTDPLLLPLADRGGSTDVYLPNNDPLDPDFGAISPAIDAGNPDFEGGGFEQRGRHFTRIFDMLGGGEIIDIGAAEVQNGTFVVDVLVDIANGQFSANGFYESPGDFSLREANDFSEKNPEIDTIYFADSLREEDDTDPFTPAPTITLTGGDLRITKPVFVEGPTKYEIEINANADGTRVFTIDDGDDSTFIDVTVSDLTLLKADGVIEGGAIHSKENLTLLDSTLKSSSVAFQGGGLFAELGVLVVEGSTFLGNFAASQGGGLYVAASVPNATISNSTFSDNTAAVNGAGLFNAGPATTLEYSTVTLNNSGSTVGSGVLNDASTGLLNVQSTIIAGNVNSDIDFMFGPGENIISDGYNLIGIGNALGSFNGSGDQTLVLDPKLAPIQLTGGPTPTHRILEDSLALDAGDPAAVAGVGGVTVFDQRGNPSTRVFDGSLSGAARIDIGAYELQETVYTVDTLADENDGDYSVENFSLREAIEVANVTDSPLKETIIFSDDLLVDLQSPTIFLSTANLVPGTSPDLRITDTVTILGPGQGKLAIDGSGLQGASSFTVDNGDAGTAVEVAIIGLRLQNSLGRAISSQENLTVDDLFFVSNAGGIAQQGAVLTASNTTMTGNSANSGGGLWVQDGELNIDTSLIVGNETSGVGSAGGGIFLSNSTATLDQVIISGNRASGGSTFGGGLYASNSTVLLKDTTLTGNQTTGSQSQGGGIVGNQSNITLDGTIVALNKTLGSLSEGGGIYVVGGDLAINSSTFTQNSTEGNLSSGGGIASVGGNVTIYQSTVDQNKTTGDDADGGGIYQTGGNLVIRDSTLSGNEVSGDASQGGGVFSSTDLSDDSTARILNSTISGNAATGASPGANKSLSRGGGIYNAAGLLDIQHSTVTDNQVPYLGQGGGVASLGDSATTRTEVLSSIIAGNSASDAGVADAWTDVDFVSANFSNSFQSLGYNLVGSGLAVNGGAFNASGDQTNVNDPMLGLLKNNGGSTSTHAILAGSLAINAGNPDFDSNNFDPPMTTDQRAATRIQVGRIDVGSVESPFAPGLAADFDTDNDVDGFDFLLWQRGFGIDSGATKADGDANLDGAVNGLDLTVWKDGFGSVAAAAATSSNTIVAASAPAVTAALVAVSPVATTIDANASVESIATNALASSVQTVSAMASTPRQTISAALSSKLLAGLDGLTGQTVRTGLSQGSGRGRTAWSRAERPRLQEVQRNVHDRLLADFAPGPPVHDRLLADEWIGVSRRLAKEQATEHGAERADLSRVEDAVFDILGAAV